MNSKKLLKFLAKSLKKLVKEFIFLVNLQAVDLLVHWKQTSSQGFFQDFAKALSNFSLGV